GGHSLLATRVVARLNSTMNIDLPLRRLFDAPTIFELAPIVENLMQTASGGRERMRSMRSLLDTANVESPAVGRSTPSPADIDRMLDGLEQLTDLEIDALL